MINLANCCWRDSTRVSDRLLPLLLELWLTGAGILLGVIVIIEPLAVVPKAELSESCGHSLSVPSKIDE